MGGVSDAEQVDRPAAGPAGRLHLLEALLARGFDDPAILRQPTSQVLDRFTAGGGRLVLTWGGSRSSTMVGKARCSCRSPPRLRRWRTTWPEDACTGPR